MATPTRIAVIYLLTCLVNGKRYIGFTTNLRQRISNHRGRAGKYGYHLANAINKHGWDQFTCEVLASSRDVEYMQMEIEPYFIQLYDTFHENGRGYNMTHGGEGTFGYKRTPEERRAMSERRKGKVATPETLAKLSAATRGENNPNYGKTHSQETRAKISAGIKQACKEGRGGGQPWTSERCARASKAVKKRLQEHPEQLAIARANCLAHAARCKGKPGHPHTEEHKQYVSRLHKGKTVSEKTRRLVVFGGAQHLWVVRGPKGIVYETCAILPFCKHFGVSVQTMTTTLDPTWVPYRKRRIEWTALSKRPITEEERQSFQEVDVFWREVLCEPVHQDTLGGQSLPVAPDSSLPPH